MKPKPHRWANADLSPGLFVLGAVFAIALQIALIATHDYFVDEWQALQIAVQTPDLRALLANLHYEGHPPLWYLILRLLARLFGAAQALMAASLICALTSLALIVTRAPLPRWTRLAIVLSEPILFEYGTIARSYALGVSLIFCVLALWDRRRAVWLPLALLPMVDFLFGLTALGLIAIRLSERSSRPIWWYGVALFGLFGVLAAWSVVPAPDFQSVYRPIGAHETIARWFAEMAVVTLPVQWNGGPAWDMPRMTPVTPLLGVAFLFIAYHQTRCRPVERLVALGLPVVLLLFMLAIHTLAIRHLMLAGVMLLAVLWRQGAVGIALRRPAVAWLIAGTLCGLATAGFAIARPFDTAPEAARKIRALGLESESWLSFPAQHAQGVSALSGVAFEGLEIGCREEFVRWNFRHRATDPGRLRDLLAREAAKGGTFYLLSNYVPAPGGPVQHLASIAPGLDGKEYHLYRIAGAGGGRRPVPPPCVDGMLPFPRG